MCGFTLMNNQIGAVVAQVMEHGAQCDGDAAAVHDPGRRGRPDGLVYDEVSEALGEEPGFFDAAEFEESMSTHYGRMIHPDDRDDHVREPRGRGRVHRLRPDPSYCLAIATRTQPNYSP